ncbi:MAG: SDR family NAD(P)-dependent oxidoreductase, partial [Microcystaceae cyanobacterium]
MSFLEGIHDANAFIVGASQGIGLGFVQKLLQDDRFAKVYATYRQPESASDLLTLQDEHPDKLTCLSMDITDESQIVDVVQQLSATINKLHLFVNCVGLLHEGDLQPEKNLRRINSEYLIRYFQVNSIGSILLAKNFLP